MKDYLASQIIRGPLFIIGTVGIGLFSNSTIGLLLFITHIFSCITVGIIFRFWKNNKKSLKYGNNQKSSKRNTNSNHVKEPPDSFNNVNFSNLGEIISKSIISATHTIIIIGGFVMLFSVILSILNNSGIIKSLSSLLQHFFDIFNIKNYQFSEGFISGVIELTNGLKIIADIPCKKISINIIITSFLLGFGGISVLLQVLAIVSKTDLSIKPYIYGKLLHGIFSVVYTYILINSFSIFNLNL